MTNFNKDDFLKSVDEIKKESQHFDKFNEFNIFNIIPRKYKREEFHSTLFASLLCKKTNPTHGEIFLKLLLDTLNEIDNGQKLKLRVEDFDDYEVITEEGGIDILIKSKSQTTEPNNVIIIENKINGAPDQPNQLKRYYDKRIKEEDRVKAIVYLPLIHRQPKGLDKEIKRLLLIFPAYQKNNKNTLIKWCEKAILQIGICEISAILHQYLSYLKFVAREEILLKEVGKFYDLLLENNNSNEFKKLKKNEKHNVLIEYGKTLELEFPRFLASDCSRFSELFEVYSDYGLDKQRDNSRSKPNDTWYYKFWNPKNSSVEIPGAIRISFNQKTAVLDLLANEKGTGNYKGIDSFLKKWEKETEIYHEINDSPVFKKIKVSRSRKFNLPFDNEKRKDFIKFIENDLVSALKNA